MDAADGSSRYPAFKCRHDRYIPALKPTKNVEPPSALPFLAHLWRARVVHTIDGHKIYVVSKCHSVSFEQVAALVRELHDSRAQHCKEDEDEDPRILYAVCNV